MKEDFSQIQSDIDDIRRNHLAHIEPDIATLKVDMATVRTNVDWLMKFQWVIITAIVGGIISLLIKLHS